jgi:hypothetical protein
MGPSLDGRGGSGNTTRNLYDKFPHGVTGEARHSVTSRGAWLLISLGVSTADVMRVLPAASRRLRQGRIATVQVVHAGSMAVKPATFVAIPILPVRAATPGVDGDEVPDLDQLKPEAIWAAPAEWCPNPASTISLRVTGNSMSPLILDGYLIAVDTSDVSRDNLVGQMVVARNAQEKRLLVSRLIRFDDTDALISDHREYQSVSFANGSPWRIVGRVLWWTGKAR